VSASVRWDGLEELKRELRNLPADLTREASHVVEGTANAAATEIKRGYGKHRRTGNLQAGVLVTHFDKGKFSTGALVKNTAKHAHLFEVGTQARHTAIGANRGSMPPGHVFVPAVIKWRRRMYQELKDILVRHGLVVTGEAK
jgi:hypothetical protein